MTNNFSNAFIHLCLILPSRVPSRQFMGINFDLGIIDAIAKASLTLGDPNLLSTCII